MPRTYGVSNVAPWATAPAVGPAGDTYYNTADKTLYISDGAAWAPVGGAASAGPPIGSIITYAAATAPSGYLACNGQAVARTGTYAALFTAIGTVWGTGDGSTTFNVPDLQGRVAMGIGSGSGLTTRALAAKLGTETVQLSAAESGVPAHTHPGINDGSFGLGVNNITPTAGANGYYTRGSAPGISILANSAAAASAAHNNVQPSTTVLYCIRYA